MNIMVSTKNGDSICKSKAEIVEIIKRGASLPEGDEMWISEKGEQYPCLSILVKGEYACAHYFDEEDGNVWQSLGEFEEGVTFLLGDEEWEAPADVIISMERAIDCTKEFYDTQKRPKCICWGEL